MSDLWRVLGYLRNYWTTALGAFLSLLIVTATNLASPQILRIVIDQGISAKNLVVVIYASLGLLGIAVVRDLASFTQSYWSEKASQGAAYDMRNAIFARLERLSFSYHDRAQTGQLMTRITSDVENVRNFTGAGILQLLNAIVMLLGSATILLISNWKLASLALLMVPAIFAVFFVFLTRVGPRFRTVQQKLGNLNTILQENLAGVRVVQAGRLANTASAPIGAELCRLIGNQQADDAHLHFPYPMGELAYLFRGGERNLVERYHSDIVRQKYLLTA